MSDGLPQNMRNKINEEFCQVAGIAGPCWTWTGAANGSGYGCVKANGKVQLTHRLAYELLAGQIPTGLQIDHLCLNKRCCNPAHLEPVTARVNTGRSVWTNKTACKNGHPYTPENTIRRNRNGAIHRQCRECQHKSAAGVRSRARAKAAVSA